MPTINASDVVFDPVGADAESRSAQSKLRDTVDILDFIPEAEHADIFAGTSTFDTSPAFANALAEAKEVRVSRAGRYAIDDMVEIGAGNIGEKAVLVSQGVSLVRLSSPFSSQTTPMFWLKSNRCALKGSGLGSKISTQNACPDGVVLIGHRNMSTSHANVTECELEGFCIKGSVNFGRTTGSPDVLVKLCNPQLTGLVSYFHRVRNLHLEDANYGVHLQGWSNGNFIRDIDAQWIGNDTLSSHRAMFFIDGALENQISGFFFHYSPGSTCVKIRDNDNTAVSGGFDHVPVNNIIEGICEQDPSPDGGIGISAPDASCTGTGNVIRLIDNCPTNDIGAVFSRANDIMTLSLGTYLRSLRVFGNIDLHASASSKIRLATGIGGDTIWRIGYEEFPSGAQVTNVSDVVHDIFDGALNGLMVRNSSGASLFELQGSTGNAHFKGGVLPGTPAGAIQTACRMYAGSGAPNNANGSNGDFYFRSDGTVAGNTVIYHKQAGAWVALDT